MRDLFSDPCERKHGGNANSVAAFDRVYQTLSNRQAAVYAHIAAAGSHGATMKEVAADLGVQLNTISGRRVQLVAKGLIRGTGVSRAGSEVFVAVEG